MLRVVLMNILLAFVVAGCTTNGGEPTPAQTNAIQDMVINQAAVAYRLGSGDQVRVIVFGEEDLSGEFVVDGAGMVSLPLVGEVPAGGKTLQEFRNEVETKLSDGYLTDPRVSAEVLNYRPFYILGEVEESGEYPYTDGLTVMNAVARAGGFTYRANTRVVFIKRADTDSEVELPLTATVRVMPGDTIRIAERFF